MLELESLAAHTERSTRKSPLTDADVTELLDSVDRVLILRGRSTRDLAPQDVELDDLKGPTGNYRAPILQFDRTLIVGFSRPRLQEILTARRR